MKHENVKTTAKNTRIRSFAVDHDTLVPGIYVSRRDGDAVTYDLRMRRPNGGDYLSPLAAHSLEHMLATYLRAGRLGERVIYVGPMGCRTGFYLIMRQAADETLEALNAAVLCELTAVLERIVAHEGGMPGAHRRECGNYRSLSVSAAKNEAQKYLTVLRSSEQSFEYTSADEGI